MAKRIGIIILCLVAWTLWTAPAARARADNPPNPTAPSPGPAVAHPMTDKDRQDFDYQMRAAREFQSRGNLDAAVIACKEAIRLNPGSVEGYGLLAKVLVQMENWAYTIQTLQTLVKLSGNTPIYARTLAQICKAYDMPIQEKGALEALIALDPKNVELYERMAKVDTELEQPREAVRRLEQAYALAPDNPRVMQSLVDAYRSAGRDRKRLTVMERLVALQPDNEEYLAELGRMYAESEEPAKALTVYQKLLARHQGDPDYQRQITRANYDLGNLYFDHGMYATALQYYGKAQPAQMDDRGLKNQLWKTRKLLHPSIEPVWQTGQTGQNRYTFLDGTVSAPLHDIDMTLRVTQSRRYVLDTFQGPAAGTDITRLSAEYRFWKDWRVLGAVGTSTHGPVGSLIGAFQAQDLDCQFGYNRDFIYETPLAISTGLAQDEYFAEAGWTPMKRLSLGAEIHRYSFTNTNNAWLTNFVVGYSVLEKPEVLSLKLQYARSDFSNKFAENPLLRFGPSQYGTNNFTAVWEHRPLKNVIYLLEYVRSYDNVGQRLDSYRGRLDVEVGLGTNVFIQHEKGAAARGVINPGSFNGQSDYRTTIGAQVTF